MPNLSAGFASKNRTFAPKSVTLVTSLYQRPPQLGAAVLASLALAPAGGAADLDVLVFAPAGGMVVIAPLPTSLSGATVISRLPLAPAGGAAEVN